MELHLANDEEKRARDRVTFPEWGTRLSLEQYLERELALRAHPFARGMRTWFLVEGSEVLASCETFENFSRVGTQRGFSWSIASVYTEERHRGKGLATRLMDDVVKRATEHGAQSCVLFSDVGDRIYRRSGYVLAHAEDWVLEPRAGEAPLASVEAPRLDEPPAGVLQLEPTLEQLDWAHARERLYARFLGRTAPATHAAAHGAARACWTAYFKSNELIVLWLTPGSPEDTARVLDVARAEAHRCGLDRVRLWSLPGNAVPGGATVQKRKDELPMFCPLGRYRIDTWRLVQRACWV